MRTFGSFQRTNIVERGMASMLHVRSYTCLFSTRVCVCVVHWVMGNTERVTVCKVERMDFVGLSVWLVTWRRLHEV